MSRSRGATIYVGNLPLDVKEGEVEDLFRKFGRIRKIELRTPMRPPAYCFVEYEDARDAEEAVQQRDGYRFAQDLLRVEIARGGSSAGPAPYGGGNGRGGYGGGGGGGGSYGGGSGFRVLVDGLPSSASWQDLKDHFRPYARPTFSNVIRERGRITGIVEFASPEDVRHVVRKLDKSRFRNIYQEATVRVYEDGATPPRPARRRSSSRSLSRSRSRTRSRSPFRRSRSGTRSRSRGRDSRSPTRSPDPRRRDRSGSPPLHSDRSDEPREDRRRRDVPNGRQDSRD